MVSASPRPTPAFTSSSRDTTGFDDAQETTMVNAAEGSLRLAPEGPHSPAQTQPRAVVPLCDLPWCSAEPRPAAWRARMLSWLPAEPPWCIGQGTVGSALPANAIVSGARRATSRCAARRRRIRRPIYSW